MASAWVKLDSLQRGAKVRVAWRSASGSTLRTDLVQATLKGTQNWTRVSALLASPAGTAQAVVQLMVAKESDGAGTAWFDDVSLADPPALPVAWVQDPEDLDGDGLLNDFETEQGLDPLLADTGGTGMSDDQKKATATATYEEVQSGAASVPSPAPSGGHGSSGACGALGLEALLLLGIRTLRRRRSA